ncbi:hypothetical protein E4U41_007268 [Claviceps citrina]|nr:hypothetical protein E4U41_007268 [Claviceps citrina]
MVPRLFRSSTRVKETATEEESCENGYDEYGMCTDKQWARKYLLDPLTAPEPNQEMAVAQWQLQLQCGEASASATGQRGGTGCHRADLRSALHRVNRRFSELRQRCRRHLPVGQSQSQSQSQSQTNTDTDTETKTHTTSPTTSPTTGQTTSQTNTNTAGQTNTYAGGARAVLSSGLAGDIWGLDPTNPYYGTSDQRQRHHSPRHHDQRLLARSPRQSWQSWPSWQSGPSGGGSHTRRSSSYSGHRRRSSGHTTASSSSPPSLYGGLDLGPYPAHLTVPRPQRADPPPAPRPAAHHDYHHRRAQSAPRAGAGASSVGWENHRCSQLETARLLRDARENGGIAARGS